MEVKRFQVCSRNRELYANFTAAEWKSIDGGCGVGKIVVTMWFVAAVCYVVLFKRLRRLESEKIRKRFPDAPRVSVRKSTKLRRVVMCCLCAMLGGANSVSGFGFKYGVPLGQILGPLSMTLFGCSASVLVASEFLSAIYRTKSTSAKSSMPNNGSGCDSSTPHTQRNNRLAAIAYTCSLIPSTTSWALWVAYMCQKIKFTDWVRGITFIGGSITLFAVATLLFRFIAVKRMTKVVNNRVHHHSNVAGETTPENIENKQKAMLRALLTLWVSVCVPVIIITQWVVACVMLLSADIEDANILLWATNFLDGGLAFFFLTDCRLRLMRLKFHPMRKLKVQNTDVETGLKNVNKRSEISKQTSSVLNNISQ